MRGFLALLLFLVCGPVLARQVVKVGGYEFAPFVERSAGGPVSGLTLAFIEALNRHQDRFAFEFVLTSPNRRYADFEARKFDVMFFESPDWGWQAHTTPVDASRVFLTGGEQYIALAKPGRGQDYFRDFGRKRMVGMLGYHYGFAKFEADPVTLARTYRMTLVNDTAASIELILKERGDVAVVTDAYLKRYLRQHPDAASRLLISQHFDQPYSHRILVRPDGAISAGEVNTLLDAMEADGTLSGLWRASGILDAAP
ncbi:ABC-type amino acid transport/signal transduction systems, periplasmic component/domain [Candidatus Terasakiella magnetica]|nr:ABC-type amino acid transport/signal transduction systems, periplasmic component/domain [Candidatus Terasakiella magnetica]